MGGWSERMVTKLFHYLDIFFSVDNKKSKTYTLKWLCCPNCWNHSSSNSLLHKNLFRSFSFARCNNNSATINNNSSIFFFSGWYEKCSIFFRFVCWCLSLTFLQILTGFSRCYAFFPTMKMDLCIGYKIHLAQLGFRMDGFYVNAFWCYTKKQKKISHSFVWVRMCMCVCSVV